jgi:hypothetical protein
MHAREPFLLVKRKAEFRQMGLVALLMIVRQLNGRGAEGPTSFVRRQRMIGTVDALAQFHVVKAAFEKLVNDISQNFAIGRSQRTDRIPHAEELDLCQPGMTILAPIFVGLLAFRFPIVSFVLVVFVGFSDERQIVTFQNAKIVNEARDTARREGAATKTEKKNLVAVFVIADDEGIGVNDIIGNAKSKSAPTELFAFSRAHASDLMHELRIAFHVLGFGGLQHPQNIGAVLGGLVPCAIAEDGGSMGQRRKHLRRR